MADATRSWQALLAPGAADDFFADPPAAALTATAAFSATQAWWLAELSRLVYRDDDREQLLAQVGLRELARLDRGGSHAAVIAPRDGPERFAVAVFRGTDDLRDWLVNLRALPTRWPRGGEVHRGFRRALAKVWRPLRRAVRDRHPLLCAGHSLGGAMAALAGSLLRPRAVYTFGAPPLGDRAFAASLRGVAVHRVVHGLDLVPRLELPGLQHAGELHRVGARAAAAPAAAPPAPWRWLEPPRALLDHAPVRYRDALRRAARDAADASPEPPG